mmetsp:Transcript_41638/g.102543  ORF Transcript_41638/g.102543 Transcript_41638/m.102543 type:complete len:313 (-) Transcript_41638:36-974(-)
MAQASQHVFWFSAFCGASVGMQVLNKAIAMSLREQGSQKLDNAIMSFQQIVAIVLNFLFAFLFPKSETWQMKRVTFQQARRLVLPSANFVFMLLCSLKALKSVHVATVVVARNMCTVFIAGGEAVVFGRTFAMEVWLALMVTVVGSVVYALNDLHFDAEGYWYQALNSFFFCVGQLYEKWAMDKSTDQTPLGISTLKNALSLPVLGSLMVVFGEVSSVPALLDLPPATHLYILLSGFGCCALSIVYMTLYKISTATAVTVASNFNKVVAILVSSYLFAGTLGVTQMVGLLVCILGCMWYSFAAQRQSKQKEK